jgi:hypothetical protein
MVLSTHIYRYISSQGYENLFMLDAHYVLKQQHLAMQENRKDETQPVGISLEFIFLSTSSLAQHNEGSRHTLLVLMTHVCRAAWKQF